MIQSAAKTEAADPMHEWIQSEYAALPANGISMSNL